MTELLAVVAITFFAVISPGPDFAMVSRNSLLLSRRTGVLTALGIAHRFDAAPGVHSWDFWDMSLQKCLAYFFD